jgi:hypothetical protein
VRGYGDVTHGVMLLFWTHSETTLPLQRATPALFYVAAIADRCHIEQRWRCPSVTANLVWRGQGGSARGRKVWSSTVGVGMQAFGPRQKIAGPWLEVSSVTTPAAAKS